MLTRKWHHTAPRHPMNNLTLNEPAKIVTNFRVCFLCLLYGTGFLLVTLAYVQHTEKRKHKHRFSLSFACKFSRLHPS